MEGEPRPRLCYLTKGERGYGFHLHGERNRGGQFIRTVDPGSPADMGGLRAGDRVVEVNGENVENDTHHQVVNRIREVPHRTRLLVVDRETDDYLRARGSACTEDLAVETGTLSPRPSPAHTPSDSPVPRDGSPLHKVQGRPQRPAAGSPSLTALERIKRASVTSSTAADPEPAEEPSPEPAAERLPRLCHLVKGQNGFGFNLHSDKQKGGQFVRAMDAESAAQSAGVRVGDRVVEVNGVATAGLRHSEVVALIRAGGSEVRLLVVDRETDELYHSLGITPTSQRVKEMYVDAAAEEVSRPTPSPTPEPPAVDPPVINVTLTNSPVASRSPKSRTNGSSASQSSRSSATQSEISSSDMSIPVPDEDERRVSDPFLDSGLRLSPTAAEAKLNVLGRRTKKRAPPMDWSKKQQIFSNF